MLQYCKRCCDYFSCSRFCFFQCILCIILLALYIPITDVYETYLSGSGRHHPYFPFSLIVLEYVAIIILVLGVSCWLGPDDDKDQDFDAAEKKNREKED